MAKKHYSYKGKAIDMEMLTFANKEQVALGNAQMNARGDIIGRGGVIVKTREELLREDELRQEAPDYIPTVTVKENKEIDIDEVEPPQKVEPKKPAVAKAPKKPSTPKEKTKE